MGFPFTSLDLNENNIAGLIALNKVTVNIPNVYENNLFNIELIKNFDQKFGYQTKSLLARILHEKEVANPFQAYRIRLSNHSKKGIRRDRLYTHPTKFPRF